VRVYVTHPAKAVAANEDAAPETNRAARAADRR
jgi:hypothetical protein